MVFLALTPEGLREALALSRAGEFAVWCGADAISEAEYASLSAHDLSRFEYNLGNESAEVLAGALETIAEHHPGERTWIERRPPLD